MNRKILFNFRISSIAVLSIAFIQSPLASANSIRLIQRYSCIKDGSEKAVLKEPDTKATQQTDKTITIERPVELKKGYSLHADDDSLTLTLSGAELAPNESSVLKDIIGKVPVYDECCTIPGPTHLEEIAAPQFFFISDDAYHQAKRRLESNPIDLIVTENIPLPCSEMNPHQIPKQGEDFTYSLRLRDKPSTEVPVQGFQYNPKLIEIPRDERGFEDGYYVNGALLAIKRARHWLTSLAPSSILPSQALFSLADKKKAQSNGNETTAPQQSDTTGKRAM